MEGEALAFGLLTIAWADRWAFATVFGPRVCFDVAGLRLLIWHSKDGWSPPRRDVNMLCSATFRRPPR